MCVLAYSLFTLKLMLLTPTYTIKKAYGGVKLKAYDNYIKSNRKDAENRRPLCSVCIRIVHNRKPGYIKTNKIVDADHISKENEPTDPVVNEYCSMFVLQYTERLNRANTTLWSVSEIIEYLLKPKSVIRDFFVQKVRL